MNSFKKSVVWLLAALAIVIFAFGFFGANNYYGDVTTVVITAAKAVETGADLGDTIRLTYTPSTEDTVLTEEQLQAAKQVIAQRLGYYKAEEAKVFTDSDSRSVVVEMPFSNSVSTMASNLGISGGFVVRTGTEETDDSVLFDGTSVKSCDGTFSNYSYFQIATMTIGLNKEATAIVKEKTQEAVKEMEASEEKQLLSFWYGGQQVGTMTISSAITNGKLQFTSYSLDQNTFNQMKLELSTGAMPVALSYATAIYNDAQTGALMAAYVALGCLFCLFLIYLFLRYRVPALIGAVCTIGTMGGIVMVVTGFMSGTTMVLTLPAFLGLAFVLALAAFLTLGDCAAIRRQLALNSPVKACQLGLKNNLGFSMRTVCAALVLSLLLMGFKIGGIFFKPAASWLYARGVGTAFLSAVGGFATVVFWGTLICAVFNVLFARLMLNSFAEYKLAKKASAFGGSDK